MQEIYMKDLSPLEIILSQLNDFYEYIILNQDKKIEITPEVKQAVDQLSKEVARVADMTQDELTKAGISKTELDTTILGSKSQLTPELKDFLMKTQQLKCQLEGCQNVVKGIIKKQKETELLQKGTGSKRKDKFKQLGSKKGWIPL